MFEISKDDIMSASFNSSSFPELLYRLVVFDCSISSILAKSVDMCFQAKPDGGIDAVVYDIEADTEYMQKPITVFQVKSNFLKVDDAKKSIIPFPTYDEKHRINKIDGNNYGTKDFLRNLLNKGCSYIWFAKCELTPRQKTGIKEETARVFNKYYKLDIPFEISRVQVYDVINITNWVNQSIVSQKYVCSQIGKDNDINLQTLDLWTQSLNMKGELSIPFTSADIVLQWTAMIHGIINGIGGNSCLVSGPSGIGKTRFVHHVMNNIHGRNPDANLPFYSNSVIYISLSQDSYSTRQVFRLMNSLKNHTLIIDDCSYNDVDELISRNQSIHNNNKLIIITNENIVGECRSMPRIDISPDNCRPIVSEYLKIQSIDELDKCRIAEYASGFIFFAKLMVDSIHDSSLQSIEGNIISVGGFITKKIIDNLYKDRVDVAYKVLQACSIFTNFMFYEDQSNELKFIAHSLVCIAASDDIKLRETNRVCQIGIKNGIFESKGRFISIRPKPLAMYLALQYIQETPKSELTKFLELLSNAGMMERFCKQIEQFRGSEHIEIIVEHILKDANSPFSNRNILFTEQGARVFLSFCGVHPNLCLKELKNTFGDMPIEEIKAIVISRRHIVNSLEKLVFCHEFFRDSVNILYKFAQAENESWSNNATGILTQLFHIDLPGTEINLEIRKSIISSFYQEADNKQLPLLLQILEHSIRTGYFSRSSGPEHLSAGISRKDYHPSCESEIKEYQLNSLYILKDIIDTKPTPFNENAISIIINGLNGLISRGHWRSFLEVFGLQEWTPLHIIRLQSILNTAFKFGFFKDQQHFQSASEYCRSLYSDPFMEKIVRLVLTPEYEIEGNINTTESKIDNLVDEIINNHIDIREYLELLFCDTAKEAYYFGKQLANRKYQVKETLSFMLEILKSNASLNTAFVLGYLICSNDQDKALFYEQIIGEPKLQKYVFRLVAQSNSSIDVINSLFSIVDDNPDKLGEFSHFRYGRAIAHLSIPDRLLFYNTLCKYGSIGKQLAVIISYMDVLVDRSIFTMYDELLIGLLFDHEVLCPTPMLKDALYDWSQLIMIMLDLKPECVNQVTSRLFQLYQVNYEHSGVFQSCRDLYVYLYNNFFDAFWGEFSKLLEHEDAILRLRLKYDFGWTAGDGFSSSIVGSGFEDKILSWCKTAGVDGASRLIRIVQLYDTYDNIVHWTPLSLSLIREYWKEVQFVSSIELSLGNSFTIGSGVSYIRCQIDLYKQLKDLGICDNTGWIEEKIESLEKEAELMRIRHEERYL